MTPLLEMEDKSGVDATRFNLDKSGIGSTRNPERSYHKIHPYFLKMPKVPFLQNEFNTYSVAEVQLKRHQFI